MKPPYLLLYFLDHKGVLGTILIPVLAKEDTAPPPTRTPRVHTFMFPVPEHDMETLRYKVVVDSSASTALVSAMSRTLLDSLSLMAFKNKRTLPQVPRAGKPPFFQ